MTKSFHFASLFVLLLAAPFASADLVEYRVPVPETALEQFAIFQVDVQCIKSETGWILKYGYPPELTGTPTELTLRQSRFDKNFYFGENGEMQCDGSNCRAHYVGLPFDEAEVIRRLKAISKDDFEFNSRLRIARINNGDPGGTFSEGPAEYCKP